MIIKSVQIKNLRSLKNVQVEMDDLLALVGANGSGKSTFLKALDLFYSTNPRYTDEDFYAGDVNEKIRIRITFGNLTTLEMTNFSSHVKNSELTVEKELAWPISNQSQLLYGWTRSNKDFSVTRSANNAADRKTLYEELRKIDRYKDLPKWSKQDVALAALNTWEVENQENCDWERDDGRFFGFTSVGQFNLSRNTKFILIPAVRDASLDASEGKGSAINEIMELVVKSKLAQREEIKRLREETQKEYAALIDPEKIEELMKLEGELTATLKTFAPNSSVKLSWSKADQINFPPPKTDVKIMDEEKGHPCSVDRTGHGLQRAYILTMLQHLALAQSMEGGQTQAVNNDTKTESEIMQPNIILAIEEPELYLHPNRQRHLAQVLLDLATGELKGIVDKMQIIYCTHSPFFVGIDRFQQVRLFRKHVAKSDGPKNTRIYSADPERVANIVGEADGKDKGEYTWQTLKPRLKTIMTPWMNEGFFAEMNVLVEGEEDRAVILGFAHARNINLESRGISVIPCMGKNNIDRATAIFSSLGIPVYGIWDGDKGGENAKAEHNHNLLRLYGMPIKDWPCFVTNTCTCFESKLSETLCQDIGKSLYDSLLDECRTKYGYRKIDDCRKNPLVMQEVIEKVKKTANTKSFLDEVMDKILSSGSGLINCDACVENELEEEG